MDGFLSCCIAFPEQNRGSCGEDYHPQTMQVQKGQVLAERSIEGPEETDAK